MPFTSCGHDSPPRKASGLGWLKTLFGLPMWVGPSDLKQMNGIMLYLLRLSKEHPAGGRFNAEEKFEYIGVFWGSIVLGSTGVLMWFNAWTTQHLPRANPDHRDSDPHDGSVFRAAARGDRAHGERDLFAGRFPGIAGDVHGPNSDRGIGGGPYGDAGGGERPGGAPHA